MKPVLVVIFSVFAIILGFSSIGLQLAALVLYTRISNFVVLGYDVVAHGIWCGFLYIVAGSQGLYSSYNQPKALFMTVVAAAVAVCGAIVAATLSGLVASSGFSYACDPFHYSSTCIPWLDLEWALMGISILAGINNLTLMYYADVARKSDKCRERNRNIRGENHSEPPGPYVIYGRNNQQPQAVRDAEDATTTDI